MTPEPGRFLLVALAPDLAAEHTTVAGVRAGIRILAGVRAITDLAYISQETLDTLLMIPSPEPPDYSVQDDGVYQLGLIA